MATVHGVVTEGFSEVTFDHRDLTAEKEPNTGKSGVRVNVLCWRDTSSECLRNRLKPV